MVLLRFNCVFVLASVVAMIGCDSSPPASSTRKISPDAENSVTVKDSFESSDKWETIDGEWKAEQSGDVAILKQAATHRNFPVTLLKDHVFSDVDIRVDFRPLSGKVDASGGIVFRAGDGKNYYVVRANSLEDNFRLYTVIDGKRSQIASTKADPPALGERHFLRVVAVGDHIQAYLNDALLIDHHDWTFASGRVGLWTKADAVTEFTGFEVIGVKTDESDE